MREEGYFLNESVDELLEDFFEKILKEFLDDRILRKIAGRNHRKFFQKMS